MGRFLTQDPIGFVNGLNLYTYCSNNPINFVDPWGLCKQQEVSSLVLNRILSVSGIVMGGISMFTGNPMLTALGISISAHAILIEQSSTLGLSLSTSGLIIGGVGFFTGNPFLNALGLSLAIHGFIMDLPSPISIIEFDSNQ